jgi:hypothetical protein
VEHLLSRGLAAARKHHASAQDAEAALMINAVAAIDDEYPGLEALRSDLDPDVLTSMNRGWLGMNRKLRPAASRPIPLRVLLYLPDRVLDLMDVVTVGVHFGLGAFVDAHATRAMQLAGGFRSTGGLGLHDQRSLGMKAQAEAGLTVVAAGGQSYVGGLIGTSGALGGFDSTAGLHQPGDRLYQEFRDYWAVGASATALMVGFEADLHPIQLVDFLTGFVGIDLLHDDFAHTRGLSLGPADPTLLAEIWQLRRSRGSLDAYLDARRSGVLLDGISGAAP